MASLIEQLSAAGYDTSGLDENQIVQKLDQAGYDTSSLAPQQKPQEPPIKPTSFLEHFKAPAGGFLGPKPTSPISPLDALKEFQDEAQHTGEEMAEKIGHKTAGTPLEKVGPYIGGAVGTAFAMVPDIIANQVLTPTAKVVGPKAIQGGMEMAASGGNKLRTMAEALTGPGKDAAVQASKEALQPLQGRLLAQQGAIASLPERTAARAAKLMAEKTGYGKAIGQAEELGGFAAKNTPQEFIETIKDPKALQDFSKTMRKIADTPLEDLVKTGDTAALQTARKFGQTFRELGPKLNKEITSTISANVKMGAGKSTEALSKIDETFGSAIKAWEKVDSRLKNLPAEAKNQKAAITQATRQTKYAMQQTKTAMDAAIKAGVKRDKLREILFKYGIGGTAAGLGWKIFH